MLCATIHKLPDGCPQEIPDAAPWRYCPRCGSKIVHLPLDEKVTISARPGQAESKLVLTLRSEGRIETAVDLTLLDAPSGARLLGPTHLNVRSGTPASVRLELPPLTRGARPRLDVSSDDGPRDPASDPWQPIAPRRRRVQMTIKVDTPADVRLCQEALFFRDGVSERTIRLFNHGDLPLDVVSVSAPDAYEITPPEGVVPGHDALTLTARLVPGERPPESDTAVIRFTDGSEAMVTLYSRASSGVRLLPKAIIGIDFGTASTSVVFREYQQYKHVEDKVDFLELPGEEDPRRFRTRIWVGEDGSVKFSSEATRRFAERESDGFLFREIKTLLREPSRTDLIYPQERRKDAVEWMRKKHGDNWPQWLVTRYLSWLRQVLIQPEIEKRYSGVQAKVVYIFSLPVLDFQSGGDHSLYDTQREQMESCIASAGFPMDSVKFQFEPVCAALGLLHPPKDAAWPVLGTQEKPISDGDRIALFDSGGGTTDVVLMRAEREGIKVLLSVEKCLGVGKHIETFGGEVITTSLIQAIDDPRSIVADKGEWVTGGTISLRTIFKESLDRVKYDSLKGIDAGGLAGDTEDLKREIFLRDAAETLKAELAKQDQVVRSGTVLHELLLYYLTKDSLKSLSGMLRERIFSQVQAEDTNYYIGLGGNVLIPYVGYWIALEMKDYRPESSNRRLMLPESDLKIAVAYGTVWVYDSQIRNAVPYQLNVYIDQEKVFCLTANTVDDKLPEGHRLSIGKLATANIEVKAQVKDEEYLIDSNFLSNYDDEEMMYELTFGVQNGRLRVSYSLTDNPDQHDLVDYRL